MLSKLTIENYALIDKSAIDFKRGFTIITGQTGAGKSIMLGALSLLTGSRADSKVMWNKEKKTIVEAIFSNPDPELKTQCEENGIEWDGNEIILRREISPSGKSRAFVNDTPVNLTTLAGIAENLIDIHSQHNNSLLNKPREQLAIIDSYTDSSHLLESYRESFKKYVNLRNRIKQIKDNITKGKENEEFIKFRLEQLDKLKPKRGELSVLEREAELLGDADRIKSHLDDACEVIDGGSYSALHQIQSAASELDSIDFDLLDPSGSDDILERINSLKIELRDIADTLEGYSEKIKSDPERYEKIQRRIGMFYEMMKRFKVKDENELVDMHQHLREELETISGNDTDVSKLEAELKELAKELKSHAESLSESRISGAEKFSRVLTEKIMPLGLPNVKFEVEINKGKLTSDGQDVVTFMCSFNKNHPLQPVAEIASGGELSRVMLGIKSLMAENMNLPTIIFDEIDTGVSGEIAHKMGAMMKEIAKNLQIITVTHLPQVAACGDIHLKVYKDDNNEKTVSHIRELTSREREQEIAGMLSGTVINDIALENARQMLNSEEK